MAKKRHRRRLRPEKRRARFISTVVMVIAACVFLYAAYNLFLIFSEYNKGDNEYQSLEQSVISIEVPQSEGEEEKFKVDFETLKEEVTNLVMNYFYDEHMNIVTNITDEVLGLGVKVNDLDERKAEALEIVKIKLEEKIDELGLNK